MPKCDFNKHLFLRTNLDGCSCTLIHFYENFYLLCFLSGLKITFLFTQKSGDLRSSPSEERK